MVAGTYAAGQGPGDAPAEWHVQLARDADFSDLVVDARVPVGTVALAAQKVPPGSYATRVSAIDSDAFEGKWSAVAKFTVSQLALAPLPHRRVRIESTDKSLRCSIDQGTPQAFPFEVSRNSEHKLSCTSGGGTDTYAIAPLPIATVHAKADLLWQEGHRGTLRVVVTDENDEPLDQFEVVADHLAGFEVGEFRRFDADGVYVAQISWPAGALPTPFGLRVGRTHVVETNTVTLERAPVAPLASASRVELSLSGAGALRGFKQVGYGGFAGVGLSAPLNGGVGFAEVRGFLERYPEATVDAEIADGSTSRVAATCTTFGGAMPIGFRFARPDARVAPYILVGPQLARLVVETSGKSASTTSVGGYGALGLDLRTDPGAIFVEIGLRGGASVASGQPTVTTTTALFGLGYHFSL